MADQPAHRAAVVEFEHVTKHYDPPVRRKDGTMPATPGAVNDLSLTVPAGKVTLATGTRASWSQTSAVAACAPWSR